MGFFDGIYFKSGLWVFFGYYRKVPGFWQHCNTPNNVPRMWNFALCWVSVSVEDTDVLEFWCIFLLFLDLCFDSCFRATRGPQLPLTGNFGESLSSWRHPLFEIREDGYNVAMLIGRRGLCLGTGMCWQKSWLCKVWTSGESSCASSDWMPGAGSVAVLAVLLKTC